MNILSHFCFKKDSVFKLMEQKLNSSEVAYIIHHTSEMLSQLNSDLLH